MLATSSVLLSLNAPLLNLITPTRLQRTTARSGPSAARGKLAVMGLATPFVSSRAMSLQPAQVDSLTPPRATVNLFSVSTAAAVGSSPEVVTLAARDVSQTANSAQSVEVDSSKQSVSALKLNRERWEYY